MHNKPLASPQRQSITPRPMHTFNGLRPRKLERQGDIDVSDARDLLDRRGAELSQPVLERARETLACVQDYKETLSGKCLLKRIKLARLYVEKAREALHNIKCWLGPPVQPVNPGFIYRPIHSR